MLQGTEAIENADAAISIDHDPWIRAGWVSSCQVNRDGTERSSRNVDMGMSENGVYPQ